MKITATMPVRNEAPFLGFTLRALLRWVDCVVVLLHNCTDDSERIACDVADECRDQDNPYGRILFCSSTNTEVWAEMQDRQKLLDVARMTGASHIVTVDADEVLSANLLPTIRQEIERMPAESNLQIPWIQCRGSLKRYINTGVWAQQDVSIAFRDDPRYCWQTQPDGYQHHHRAPMGIAENPYRPLLPAFVGRWRSPHVGGLMHLQMVNDRRLRAKQALYVMNERLRWPERPMPDYAGTVYAPGHTVAETPAEWWKGYEDIMRYLDLEAVPWQEQECIRLMKQHGPRTFAGLDLFGVVG